MVGLVLRLQGEYTKYPCVLCLWDSRADDQHHVRQEWPLRQGLKPGSYHVQYHPFVEPNKILLTPLYIKLGVMKNFVKVMDRGQRVCFPPAEAPMDTPGEPKGRYIWRPSNKRTHEEPNIWRSPEQSWTVRRAVTEVSSYKLPGKPPECRIREGNWRATTRSTNVSQTALSAVTLGLFSKELWRFKWRTGSALSPKHLYYEKDVNFLVDYWGCLKQDVVAAEHRRKSLKRPFIHEFLLCNFQFTMAQYKLSANISTLNLALFV